MDFKVKISNLPSAMLARKFIESVKGFYDVKLTNNLTLKAVDFESHDELYHLLAALGLGNKNGCKVDISDLSAEEKSEDFQTSVIELFDQPHVAQALARGNRDDVIEIDFVALEQQQAGTHHPQLNPKGNAKPKSPSSDDLVAVYYFTNAVMLELGCNGVEFSDIQGNFADGEAEFVAELADYAIMASQTVTSLYSETGATLPGKFEYEVLTMGSPLIEEFSSYILDPKPSLPDMEEWGKMCLSFISKWIRNGEPLPIETILSGVKSGAYDLGLANLELRQHKIMITSFCEVEGEFRIKSVM